MNSRFRWIAALLALMLAVSAPWVGAFAQADGTLTFAQPVLGALEDGQDVLSYSYTAVQATSLSLQVISEAVAATITIRDEAGIVAQELNAGSSLIATISAVLSPAVYTVEIGSANGAAGSVVVAIQSETPLVVQTLNPGALISAEVSAAAPVTVYSFSALAEPAVLTFESILADGGPSVRIMNVLTRAVVATIAPEWGGAIYSIPANGQAYELMITHSGRPTGEGYNLCLRAASGACEGTPLLPQTQPAQPAQPIIAACTVTPLQAGGANIRQSTSTNAPVLSVLAGGQTASVIGVSPDSAWFNVTFGAVIGWVARSAVVESGDCATVPVVQPPPFQPASQPTQPPAQPQPTQPPAQPTQPPAPTPIPTMSGPCLITITAPTYIYQSPLADISNLQDQVMPPGELIPTGRLADNSWWRLNFAGAWIETSLFGVSAQVTGDCSGLPVTSP